MASTGTPARRRPVEEAWPVTAALQSCSLRAHWTDHDAVLSCQRIQHSCCLQVQESRVQKLLSRDVARTQREPRGHVGRWMVEEQYLHLVHVLARIPLRVGAVGHAHVRASARHFVEYLQQIRRGGDRTDGCLREARAN